MDTYEHIFAKAAGISPAEVKDLRKSLLTPEEWRLVPGKGIQLSDSGLEKIKAALPGLALAGPPGDPPAVRDFRIRRVFGLNRRIVEGMAEDGTVANIRVRDSEEMGLQPGMVLPGCTPRVASPVWNFTGRARIR